MMAASVVGELEREGVDPVAFFATMLTEHIPMMKKTGPKTDPLPTPESKVIGPDSADLILHLVFLFVR